MNKNGFFKCGNCGHFQHTTEFGQCEECDYEDLIEISEREYMAGTADGKNESSDEVVRAPHPRES